MKRRIAQAIEQVGHWVTLQVKGKSYRFQASLQPDLTKEVSLASGAGPGFAQRYQLFAGVSEEASHLAKGSILSHQGTSYLIERVDCFYLGEQLMYYRARLLRWEDT